MAEKEKWLNDLNEAMELLESGQSKLSLVRFRAILQNYGKTDLCRALVLDGMGRAHFADNESNPAMEAFKESLGILRELYVKHEISAQFLQGALQNQAHARAIAGFWDEAIKLGKEALELAEKSGDEKNLAVAQALFHLSAPYYNKKEYDQAEKLLKRAIRIWESQSGAFAEKVGTCLNNLGRIYEERGQNEVGADYHRRAVELRRSLPNKEDLAFSLGNYGIALGACGKFQEACAALQESLVIYKALGKEDSEVSKAFEANLSLLKKSFLS